MVSIETVVLFNRNEGGTLAPWERTKNVEVRLANELPPKPTTGMFTGGILLGRYKGPAGKGEIVEIRSSPGCKKKRGRYLIIQIDMDAGNDRLNLKEVFAYGHSHFHSAGSVIFLLKSIYEIEAPKTKLSLTVQNRTGNGPWIDNNAPIFHFS